MMMRIMGPKHLLMFCEAVKIFVASKKRARGNSLCRRLLTVYTKQEEKNGFRTIGQVFEDGNFSKNYFSKVYTDLHFDVTNFNVEVLIK